MIVFTPSQYMTSTVLALIETAKSGKDAAIAPILADALQDAGYEKESIADLRKPITYYVLTEWLMDNLGLDVGTVGIDRAAIYLASMQLARANGRRRERILTTQDIEYCVRRLRESDLNWKAIGGGTVANAYNYRSYQTCCLCAVRSDGTVRIAVGVADGKKGASLVTPVSPLRINSRPEAFRAWADEA